LTTEIEDILIGQEQTQQQTSQQIPTPPPKKFNRSKIISIAAGIATAMLVYAYLTAGGGTPTYKKIEQAIWNNVQTAAQPYEKLEKIIRSDEPAPNTTRPMWLGENQTHYWIVYALYSPKKQSGETVMAYDADIWGFYDKEQKDPYWLEQRPREIYRQIGLHNLNQTDTDYTPVPWWEQTDDTGWVEPEPGNNNGNGNGNGNGDGNQTNGNGNNGDPGSGKGEAIPGDEPNGKPGPGD